MNTSKEAHQRMVYQVEKKAEAQQALRNIENGVPLATDFKTVRDFINHDTNSGRK